MNKLICAIVSLLFILPAFGQLHVTQTTTASGAGSPMSASFSAPPAPGDVLVALIGYYTGSPVTTPFGWKVLKQQNGSGTTGFTSFYHVVVAGESNSYTFNPGDNSATLALYDIVGADIYNPFNNFASSGQTTTTASVITPSVIPSVLGTLPLAAVADEGSQPTGVITSGWKYTAPASNRHPVGAAYGPLTTSTTNGVSTQFSLTNADGYGLAPVTVLVNPAGTTGHTPVAVAGGPYAGVTNIGITFDGSASTDPRNEALTYSWTFGDHTTGTGIRASHVYTAIGSYTVGLTVTDVDGNIANSSATVTVGQDCSGVALGNLGALNNFVPSPMDAWHQDISGAAVDPMSNTIMVTNASDLAGMYLHPDFGGNGAYGIPYTVVDSSVTPSIPIVVNQYPDESDLAYYPIPANMPIESAPASCTNNGDNHAIVFDKHSCVVHEMYQAQSCKSGNTTTWSAGSTAMWDLTQAEQRPYGMTSVDAAGLSVFEGLIRYDEIVAGTINHAIRFTARYTKNNQNNGYFTGAATHSAGTLWGTDNVEGMRIRLKANYDISGFSPQAKIIATAMKKYGMILADNGSNLYFQGTPDLRWNDDDLDALKRVPSSAFEVINQSLNTTYTPGAAPLYPKGPIMDAANHPTGAAPTITSFTASSSSISAGQSVTLTPNVLGSSYSYIDVVGFVRGPVTVTPTTTTTYTLTSRNAYGTTSASTTVTVSSAAVPSLSFAPVADRTFGAAPFPVSATSNSSGAIAYTVVSGPASVAGSTVTLTGVGVVTLQATQAATATYTVTTAQVSFTVKPTAPALVFTPVADKVFGAAPFTVSSTSNSTGGTSYTVVSGPASLYGNTVTLNGQGRVVLMVSQAAAGNYAAATATISFNVTSQVPQLAFSAVPTQTYGAGPFAVNASSNSSGAISYTVTGGPAMISGNAVTLTGAGTVQLLASQAAAGGYAATSATTSFTVNASPTTVSLKLSATTVDYPGLVFFDVHVTPTAVTGATGQVLIFDGVNLIGSFPLTGLTNGEVQGALPAGLMPGQHSIAAVYSGDRNYLPNRSASIALTVAVKPFKVGVKCYQGVDGTIFPSCVVAGPGALQQ